MYAMNRQFYALFFDWFIAKIHVNFFFTSLPLPISKVLWLEFDFIKRKVVKLYYCASVDFCCATKIKSNVFFLHRSSPFVEFDGKMKLVNKRVSEKKKQAEWKASIWKSWEDWNSPMAEIWKVFFYSNEFKATTNNCFDIVFCENKLLCKFDNLKFWSLSHPKLIRLETISVYSLSQLTLLFKWKSGWHSNWHIAFCIWFTWLWWC